MSKLPAMESARRDSLTNSHAAASSRFDDDSEDPPLLVSVEESELTDSGSTTKDDSCKLLNWTLVPQP